MSKYVYPDNLVELVRKRWDASCASFGAIDRSKQGDEKKAEFESKRNIVMSLSPSDAELRLLLDTIYHTSFLTEEARRIGVRIMFIPSDLSKASLASLNAHTEPVRFEEAINFDSSSLMKLAPAIKATDSAILVCRSEGSEANLNVWGLLNLGSDWWDLEAVREAGRA